MSGIVVENCCFLIACSWFKKTKTKRRTVGVKCNWISEFSYGLFQRDLYVFKAININDNLWWRDATALKRMCWDCISMKTLWTHLSHLKWITLPCVGSPPNKFMAWVSIVQFPKLRFGSLFFPRQGRNSLFKTLISPFQMMLTANLFDCVWIEKLYMMLYLISA